MLKIKRILFLSLFIFPVCCQAELFFYPALSASSGGTAYANAVAGTEDITQQFYNPAVTCYFYNNQFGVSPSLYMPRDDFANGDGLTADGTELSGEASVKDFTPAIGGGGIYGSLELKKWLRFGAAITTPWRRRANYAYDWIGRYYGTRLELMSTNITPSLAFSIYDFISLSAGLQVDYFNVKYEEAIDFGSIASNLGIAGASPGNQDGFLNVNADDWAYGWVAGLIVQPCYYIRLGLTYRSKVVHKFCFLPKFQLSSIGEDVYDSTGLYKPFSDAEMTICTPQMYMAGIHYYHDNQCELSAGLIWKGWSESDGISISYGNESQPDTVLVQEGWKDTFGAMIGARYSNPCRTWYLRIGAMWEQSPVPKDSVQTPIFYGEETATIAAGCGWNYCDYAFLDFGWTHVFSRSPVIDQVITGDGNEYRGDLSGKINAKSDTILFSLALVF